MINQDSLKIPSERKLKYTHHWQRVRLKLKAQYFLKKLTRDEESTIKSEKDESLTPYGETENLARRYSMILSGSNKITDTIKLEKTPWYIIHPESRTRKSWNILMAIGLLYTAVLMPFVMAFLDTNQLDVWFYISLFLDIIFIIDFFLNCVTAYFNHEGTLITNLKIIFIDYLKSWFIIDIIACIPFSIIELSTYNSGQSSSSYIRIIKLPRIYRILRLSKLFKVISQSRYGFAEKLRDNLNLKHSSMKLLTSSAIIITCVHISGCFWYYIARINNFDETTWVYNLKYLDSPISSIYLTCIYWAVTTMTTVGYGDIHAFNNYERTFCILWMAIGIFFISFSIGRLASIINTTESKDNLLIHKLAAIDEFCSEANISKDLRKKLRHALKFSTEIQGGSWGQKEIILSELPRSLKYELALNMFQGAAKKIKFFQMKDQALIAAIVPLLQPVSVQKGDAIYKEKEIADEIFFITKGTVMYTFAAESHTVAWIHKGNYFGDIEVVLNIPRRFKAVTAKYCELFIMGGNLIQIIIETFHDVWEELSQKAISNFKLYQKTQIKIEEMHKLKANGRLGGIKFLEFKKIVEEQFNVRDENLKKSESQHIKDLVLKLDVLIDELSG